MTIATERPKIPAKDRSRQFGNAYGVLGLIDGTRVLYESRVVGLRLLQMHGRHLPRCCEPGYNPRLAWVRPPRKRE